MDRARAPYRVRHDRCPHSSAPRRCGAVRARQGDQGEGRAGVDVTVARRDVEWDGDCTARRTARSSSRWSTPSRRRDRPSRGWRWSPDRGRGPSAASCVPGRRSPSVTAPEGRVLEHEGCSVPMVRSMAWCASMPSRSPSSASPPRRATRRLVRPADRCATPERRRWRLQVRREAVEARLGDR